MLKPLVGTQRQEMADSSPEKPCQTQRHKKGENVPTSTNPGGGRNLMMAK